MDTKILHEQLVALKSAFEFKLAKQTALDSSRSSDAAVLAALRGSASKAEMASEQLNDDFRAQRLEVRRNLYANNCS